MPIQYTVKNPLSFLTIEVMSEKEMTGLCINYNLIESPFGTLTVGSTSKGICYLDYIEEETVSLQRLQQLFPKAQFQCMNDAHQEKVIHFFKDEKNITQAIPLHLKGTPFQLNVWNALLKIPLGQLSTYGKIAHQIQQSKAARAVGTAIGANPIAYLIPCHRVIQASGKLGGYRWGIKRKAAMITWEASYQD